jgi:hypothetical protein
VDNNVKSHRPIYSLWWGTLLQLVLWIGVGCFFATYGLIVKDFDTISSAFTLREPPLQLFFRVLTDINFVIIDEKIIMSFLILAIPAVSLLFIWTLFIYKDKFNLARFFKWLPMSILVTVLSWLLFMLFVPTSIVLSVFWVKVHVDIYNHKDDITEKSISTDFSVIIQQLKSSTSTNVYADYDKDSGIFMANMLNERVGKKYSYYEHLYLPVYLTNNPIDLGVSKSDNVFLLKPNSIIINKSVDKNKLKEALFILGKNIIHKSYGGTGYLDDNKIKIFDLIDTDKYNEAYKTKQLSVLNTLLASLNRQYALNQNIILHYADDISNNKIDYKKFVTDQENEYNRGCVQVILYNDCQHLKQVIENNKITVDKNESIINSDYVNAQKYNIDIFNQIKDVQKRISELDDMSLVTEENSAGEYSYGLSLNGDTIYMRFVSGGINRDYIRIMVHELLHIYSYSSKQVLSHAIDESLTDYFATRAVGYDELDSIRLSGYPLEIQIVYALMEKIPEKDLIEVYFTKDEKLLKRLITKYFPDIVYNDFMHKLALLLEGTYNLNGESHSIYNGIIDHDKVRDLRLYLGLKEYRYNGMIF